MNKPALVDVHGAALASARSGGVPSTLGRTAFEAASRSSQAIGKWTPPRTSPQGSMALERGVISARTEDLGRNNHWATSGLRKKQEMVIGAGWKFTSKPDYNRLGITSEQSKELGRQIEGYIRAYCNDTELRNDAAQRESVAMQMGSAFSHCLLTGDAFGRLHYIERGGECNTAMELLHSARCKQPTGKLPSENLRDGVELGRWGEARGYYFAPSHPNDTAALFKNKEPIRVPKYDVNGRRSVLHYFTPQEPGEFRGRSVLTPIVRILKQLTNYSDVELQAATLNAILAAFIKTDVNHDVLGELLSDGNGEEAAAGYLELQAAARSLHHDQHGLDQEGVRFSQLAIGEDIVFSNAARPAAGFGAFEMAVMRGIASALGLSLEMLLGDYSKLSYSGWRGAITNIWRSVTCERSGFEATFVRPWFRVVIEEGIARNKIKVPRSAPGFWQMPDAYLTGVWLGPGRGSADPYKDERANEVALGNMTKSLRQILNEAGVDYDGHVDELVDEINDFKSRGLVHPALLKVPEIDLALMRDDDSQGATKVSE